MKRNYIQPTVNVESLQMDSMILAGSPGGGNTLRFNATISTEDQW